VQKLSSGEGFLPGFILKVGGGEMRGADGKGLICSWFGLFEVFKNPM